MKFDLPKRQHYNLEKYFEDDIDKAYKFTNELYKEMGAFIRAVVLFGSSARHTRKVGSDIDLMIVVDDVVMPLSREVTEAYRLIVKKLVTKTSTKLHITTMRFTAFWDYMRNGDPLALNILRDGVALIDSGFFDPMQLLLKKGRIRPSQESIWTYYNRAPHTLNNSKRHLSGAVIDLYWAVVDSAHAALMKAGQIPPTPSHVGDMLEQVFGKKKKLEKKYIATMNKFYNLMKGIDRGEIKEVKGAEFDKLYLEADAFIKRMKTVIETHHHR